MPTSVKQVDRIFIGLFAVSAERTTATYGATARTGPELSGLLMPVKIEMIKY